MKTYLFKREAALIEVNRQLEEQYQWARKYLHYDLAASYTVASQHNLNLIAEVQRTLAALKETDRVEA